jgi:xanthine dehydrogenase YagS FAD-binding subunit
MNRFDLIRPDSLEQALELLSAAKPTGAAVALAGGQDLLTELAEHLVEPELVVDLSRLPDLDGLHWSDDGGLAIGAMVRLERLVDDADLRERLPVLAEAAESIASPQIRAVGTVGGNLNQRPRCWYYRSEEAHCLKKGGVACFAASGRSRYNAILGGGPSYIVHPSDLAPALVALGASFTLVGPGGERTVPAERYFLLPRDGGVTTETVRRADELLVRVDVPAPVPGSVSTYHKFKERESYDWALSAVALALVKEGSTVVSARIVLGGVAPVPWRASGAERLLEGRAIDAESINAVRDAALFGAQPLADNAYKIQLTKGVLTRALERLA